MYLQYAHRQWFRHLLYTDLRSLRLHLLFGIIYESKEKSSLISKIEWEKFIRKKWARAYKEWWLEWKVENGWQDDFLIDEDLVGEKCCADQEKNAYSLQISCHTSKSSTPVSLKVKINVLFLYETLETYPSFINGSFKICISFPMNFVKFYLIIY